MAKVFSIINYKGGVGKSTTTYHIGCSLAQHHNKRVLLIDIDPQTNLTYLCKSQERYQSFKARNGTIASLYERFQERVTLNTLRSIWQSPVGEGTQSIRNLDLIPCDIDLLGEDIGGMPPVRTSSPFEQLRVNATEYIRQLSFLHQVIHEVESKYDYILIDCPPNLYLMTQNALLASDNYLVTAIPDHLSTIGLTTLVSKVTKIGERVDQAARLSGREDGIGMSGLGGIIFTKVRLGGERITTTHSTTMESIREDEEFEMFWGRCFGTYTTELIGYSDAAEASVPIWQSDTPNAKRAAGKREYEKITREFMGRFPA